MEKTIELIKLAKEKFTAKDFESFTKFIKGKYDAIVEDRNADLLLDVLWYAPGSSWSGGYDDSYTERFYEVKNFPGIYRGDARHHGFSWSILIDDENNNFIGLTADGELQSDRRENDVYSIGGIYNYLPREKEYGKKFIQNKYPGLLEQLELDEE